MRVLVALLILLAGCGDDRSGPSCGAPAYGFCTLVPGPGEAGHDAELAALAEAYDRGFHGLNAQATGLNADVAVPPDDAAGRALVAGFLAQGAGAEAGFAAFAGRPVTAVVTSWQKSAGLYAGAGIAADAYRYGTLRDQGAAPAAVDAARAHLLGALAALHVAVAITGVEGVIARSLARRDLPGDGQSEVVPLFDAAGAPLPVEKNNGTWRADNSGGAYPEWIWEDSISRDQLIGWAMGFAAAWEVIRDDAAVAADLKQRLRADARALARGLAVVRASGYDLEIPDADGRTTYHGYLNENALERAYAPGIRNGFYAVMALGIVAALAHAAEDPELDRYLAQDLCATRDLPGMARDDMLFVDLGVGSNFSNYNMAFMGAWLAVRYLGDEDARRTVQAALGAALYAVPGASRQPREQKQSLFDFVFAAGTAGARPGRGLAAVPDEAALGRGLETLREFPRPPFWDLGRTNCDAGEIAAGACIADDGTPLELLGYLGRGDTLVAAQPVPMRVRPPSNYCWRSNPYEPNGGGAGDRLLPGVDFRVAYWLGRWVRR